MLVVYLGGYSRKQGKRSGEQHGTRAKPEEGAPPSRARGTQRGLAPGGTLGGRMAGPLHAATQLRSMEAGTLPSTRIAPRSRNAHGSQLPPGVRDACGGMAPAFPGGTSAGKFWAGTESICPTSPGPARQGSRQMPPTQGPWAIHSLISTVLATKDGPCGRECMPPLHIHPPRGPPRPLPGLELDTVVAPPRPGGKGQGLRGAEQPGRRTLFLIPGAALAAPEGLCPDCHRRDGPLVRAAWIWGVG